MRAQSTAASATPVDISAPQTPARSNSNGGDTGEASRKSLTPAVTAAAAKDDDDRAISPVSTASSASEPPLAQKVKMNGNHSVKRPTTPTPPVPVPVMPVTPVKQAEPLTSNNSVPPPSSGPAVATTATAQTGSPSRTWVSFINLSIYIYIYSLNLLLSYLNGCQVPCKR